MVNYYSEKSSLSINELIEDNLELVKKEIDRLIETQENEESNNENVIPISKNV